MFACAEVVDLLGDLASQHDCANPEKMARLDERMKDLAAVVERVRAYQGTIETWDQILARFSDGEAER